MVNTPPLLLVGGIVYMRSSRIPRSTKMMRPCVATQRKINGAPCHYARNKPTNLLCDKERCSKTNPTKAKNRFPLSLE